MYFIRQIVKKIVSRTPPKFFERCVGLSVTHNFFPEIKKTKHFIRRVDLWRHVFQPYQNSKINLLELGVFEGVSIQAFAKLNSHKGSIFVGFDSFEGLPENWTASTPAGTFSLGGVPPQLNDKRISLVKGWFQNTLPTWIHKVEEDAHLCVHFDADLYSSTLFALQQIDTLKQPYMAIFDEFTGDEARALQNYMQIHGAKVKFVAYAGPKEYPEEVCCEIQPLKYYRPSH